MALLIALTVIDILLFIGVLAYFLNRIARQLNHISATLGKVTFGVRAVETQCAVIGPAVDGLNRNLREVAGGVTQAAAMAGRLADGR